MYGVDNMIENKDLLKKIIVFILMSSLILIILYVSINIQRKLILVALTATYASFLLQNIRNKELFGKITYSISRKILCGMESILEFVLIMITLYVLPQNQYPLSINPFIIIAINGTLLIVSFLEFLLYKTQ